MESSISTAPYTFICPDQPKDSFVFNIPIEEEDELTFEELESRLNKHLAQTRSDIRNVFVTEVYSCAIDRKHTVSYYKEIQPFYIYIEYKCEGGQNESGFGNAFGTSFVNVDNQNALESRKFSPDAPKWRYVTKGTNIDGYCENPKCEAYADPKCKVESRKKVISRIGYGAFDFIQNSHEIKCPLCASVITPVTCLFSDCQFWFSGQYREDRTKPLKKANQQARKKARKDGCERYNPTENTVVWFKLLIHSAPDDEEAGCGICKCSVLEAEKVIVKECKHFYHRKCCENLNHLKKDCILCRA